MHTLLHLFKKSTVKLMLIKPFKPARAHTKYKTSIRLKIRLFFIFLEIYTHTYTYHQNYYYIFQKKTFSLPTNKFLYFFLYFVFLKFKTETRPWKGLNQMQQPKPEIWNLPINYLPVSKAIFVFCMYVIVRFYSWLSCYKLIRSPC